MSDVNKNTNTTVTAEELSFSLLFTVVIVYIILIFLTQYCWNNTLSVITKTQEITAWQSFLIIILFHILFTNHYYTVTSQ